VSPWYAGAVSRYSVRVGGGRSADGDSPTATEIEGDAGSSAGPATPLWFHVRSSGLRWGPRC